MAFGVRLMQCTTARCLLLSEFEVISSGGVGPWLEICVVELSFLIKEFLMQMLYNSDSFAVVMFDVPNASEEGSESALNRGGYEIVDKFARREIFIEGALAQSFKEGVEALIESQPSEEEIDEYLGRFSSLMQHPVVLH